MGPHDDDGSGVTFAALRALPVKPAAMAATATATPRATSQTFLLTLPPPTRFQFRGQKQVVRGRVFRRGRLLFNRDARGRASHVRGQAPLRDRHDSAPEPARRGFRRTMQAEPKWRNWQTRRTQNPVPFGE